MQIKIHSFQFSFQKGAFVSFTTYPTVTSKILDPMELDTAISPNPCRATTTLVMRSGILVPAAMIVKPIIYEE